MKKVKKLLSELNKLKGAQDGIPPMKRMATLNGGSCGRGNIPKAKK